MAEAAGNSTAPADALGIRLRRLFIAGLCVLALLLIVSLGAVRLAPHAVIEVRNRVFSSVTTDAAPFTGSPETLDRWGFQHDPAAVRRAWEQSLTGDKQIGSEVRAIAAMDDPVAKARRIVLLLAAKTSTTPELINLTQRPESLRDRLDWVSKGNGLCSDYSEAFLSVATATGLPAREINNKEHTVCEVWDSRTGRWFFIDPSLALMAEDKRGRMSFLDLRRAQNEDRPFRWIMFGRSHRHASRTYMRPVNLFYNAPGSFTGVYLTMGDDVLSQDRFLAPLSFAPKPVSHLIAFTAGAKPRYLLYGDAVNAAQARAWVLTRVAVFALLACLAISLAAWPTRTLFTRIRPSRHR